MTADRTLELSELSHQKLALLASGLEEERDELVKALRLADAAMQLMGDILNNSDMSEPEDIAITTPGFRAVSAALAKYPAPKEQS